MGGAKRHLRSFRTAHIGVRWFDSIGGSPTIGERRSKMKRRNVLAVLGSATAASTSILGSGAFTSTRAHREITIRAASDNDALLALEGLSRYASQTGSDSTLSIRLDESNGRISGDGVNSEAVTRFNNLFEIQNRGTNPVILTGKKAGKNTDAVTFAVNFSKEHPNLPFWGPNNATFHYLDPNKGQNATLGVGDTIYVSMEVDARGVQPGERMMDSLSISAVSE